MQLIPDWRQSWKFWSIRFGILGTCVASIFLAAPDAALYAWALLPDDIKSHLPPAFIKFSGVGILVLSFIARLVRQPKLEVDNGSDTDEPDKNGY